MKHDPNFIKAWEKFSGLEWAEDYQGSFRLSFRDFKAGWDACESHLISSLSGRAKVCRFFVGCEKYYKGCGDKCSLYLSPAS